MINTNELQQKIEYIKERAIAEGSIIKHLTQEYGNNLDIDKFVTDIIVLNDEFFIMLEEDKISMYSNDDEYDYISKKTEYSLEMIELILWFEECYKMKNDCITYEKLCIKCGYNELFVREKEDEMFSSYLECGKCGEKYSFDYCLDDEENILSWDLDIEDESPSSGFITDKSYVFKVATGYRNGIWRKIKISSGATLDDLGNAILEAFYFEQDHLYAFYMSDKGRKRNVPVYYSPKCRDEPRADRAFLESFHFVTGSKFLYLFDFGDKWHFYITFDKEVEETTIHPFVVQSHGESPEQYPNYFEDDSF